MYFWIVRLHTCMPSFNSSPRIRSAPPEPIVLGHLSDQGNRFGSDPRLVRSGLGLAFPVETKELPMPAQQGLWLHEQKSLLPGSNQPGQQDEEDAIGPGERWPFHLSLEDDKLLAQEGNFRHQLGLAPAQVVQRLQRQGGSERFGPTSKARGKRLQAAILQSPEMGQNTSHNKNFSIT